MSVKLPVRSPMSVERLEPARKIAQTAPAATLADATHDGPTDSFESVTMTSTLPMVERPRGAEHPSQWGSWTSGLPAPAWEVPAARPTLLFCGETMALSELMSLLHAAA
jgi:hypothetical protein